jgi:hypothetical protein
MKIITLDDTQLGIIADGLLLLKGNESYNMEQCQEILDAIMPDCSDSMVNQTKPYDDGMASAGMGTDEQSQFI